MKEVHPYGEYIPKNARAMIIGSFPIGKFSNPQRRKEIKPHEFEFFFGGEKNLLWKLLSGVFDHPISSKADIEALLKKERIAIGDLIVSCRRKNGGGSDSDLVDIEWNKDLLNKIRGHEIKKVFFTSKKVEQWFNRLFGPTPDLKKVTLISPSAQTARGLASREDVREWREQHQGEKLFLWILEKYKENFKLDS